MVTSTQWGREQLSCELVLKEGVYMEFELRK